MSEIIWFNERFKIDFGVPLRFDDVNRSLIGSCLRCSATLAAIWLNRSDNQDADLDQDHTVS